MEITFLGHAGFLVETEKSILLIDSWLSPNGAFDGGWFQFPRNHHLADLVKQKLFSKKQIYVYVSHEHKDHFDIDFLKSIEKFDFKYIIPIFRRPLLLNKITSFSSKEIILCEDEALIRLNDEEYIKIYIEDSELNRDSAILFSSNSKKFLNLNDCKIHDRLNKIKQTEKEIDVFAVQFSGATWHPTCYDYSEEQYQKISRKKKLSKFEATAIAIENIAPKVYLPSAGPACFLDPDIIHINFEKENIFPRNNQVIEYLNKRLKSCTPQIPDITPGDKIILKKEIEIIESHHQKINDNNFEEYILNYANDYKDFFNTIKKPLDNSVFIKIGENLIDELKEKLSNFKSKNKIERPLYIKFKDHPSQLIKVSFQANSVELVKEKSEENFYSIEVNSYDIKRVLEGFLTWEDFSLTFRMKLNREPDVYQVLMQGFLMLEKEDLNYFCDKILEIENRNERIIVEIRGCKYSIDRYCPHQGADLTHAWQEDDKFLICPRHRWAFDLENGGQCKLNSASLNAIALEPD